MNSTKCYRLDQLDYHDGMLDLDATYIIHLEGNGREKHVLKQLDEYHPTNVVYILYNKGYKRCEKSNEIRDSRLDLINSFQKIFEDAIKKNYNNILVLEDDFIFSEKIKNKTIQENIVDFVKRKQNDKLIYMLGSLPFVQKPYDKYNNILLYGIGTHACIYSRKFMESTLNVDFTLYKDWDYYTHSVETRYLYHEPLCYQLFPETENQENWFSFFGMKYILLFIIKIVELNKKQEPGYTIFYNISKLIYLFFILFLILIFLFLWHIFYLHTIHRIYKIHKK
jgi:hypothetical protein